MLRVFVSYAQPEIRWAEHLTKLLTSDGVEVYVAEHDLPPGSSLSKEISKAISSCDLFVLLWSKKSADSKYVHQEAFYAHSAGKRVIPVRLAKAPPLPSFLADTKYLDVEKDPEGQMKWLKRFVAEAGQSKAVNNFVSFGLLGWVAWAVLKGD